MIGPVSGVAPSGLAGLGVARAGAPLEAPADKPSIWDTLLGRSFDILEGRYGTPEGQYTRRGPDGKPIVTYRSPEGSTTPVFGATDLGANASLTQRGDNLGGISNTTLLIIGGVVVAALFLMNRSRR